VNHKEELRVRMTAISVDCSAVRNFIGKAGVFPALPSYGDIVVGLNISS